MDLFTPEEQEKEFEVISLSDGEILFMRNFFTPSEAKHKAILLGYKLTNKQFDLNYENVSKIYKTLIN